MPSEVVNSILEYAYFDDDLEVDTEVLRACSLVCREWTATAQKLLFKHVTLRTQAAYQSFCTTVTQNTAYSRMLAECVVRLRVVLDHNQPFGLTQDMFAHAVTLCPSLFELSVAIYGCGAPGQDVIGAPDVSRMARKAPSFDESTLAMLRTGPTIQALQVNNWSENSTSVAQLLEVWPELQCLIIGGTPPELNAQSSSSPPAFPGALRELHLNFQTSPSVDFFGWLLHNSQESLNTLRIERPLPVDVVEHLLHTTRNSLRSLSLPSASQRLTQALGECTVLKDFSVDGSYVSPRVLRGLPANVEHLGFTIETPILEAVRQKEKLKAITVFVPQHAPEGSTDCYAQLAPLQLVCAERGIDMYTTSNIRRLRNMMVSLFQLSLHGQRVHYCVS